MIHPGAWLVWAAAGGIVAVLTTNPLYLVPLYAIAAFVYSARRGSHAAARSFRVFVGFGVAALVLRTALAFVGPFGRAGFLVAVLEGLRLAVVLAVFGAFNAVSDPERLLKLAPRRWHEPALAAVLALSIAPRTIEAVARVREAQYLRGIRIRGLRTLPALAVPVLENGMEGALALAESMDARGHGRGPRSRYRPERFGRSSWVVAIAAVGAAAAFAGSAAAGGGWLAGASFEGWPQASPALLGALAALALPGVIRESGPG